MTKKGLIAHLLPLSIGVIVIWMVQTFAAFTWKITSNGDNVSLLTLT